MEGDNPITKIGEGTYVVAGSEGVDKTGELVLDCRRPANSMRYTYPCILVQQREKQMYRRELSGQLTIKCQKSRFVKMASQE